MSSLVQRQFDSACSDWFSGLTSTFRNKLQVMQNNIIEYLLNVSSLTHVGDKFRSVGLLPVQLRVEQQKLHHMFNIINGFAPQYFTDNSGTYSAWL